MRIEAQYTKETAEEVLAINPNAQKPELKDFEFTVGGLQLDDTSISDACK